MSTENAGNGGSADITTLAIELQSREAEQGLKNFNDLMIDASKLASGWKGYKIEIDTQGALAQLRAMKAEYIDLSAVARKSFADMPKFEMPSGGVGGVSDSSGQYGMLVEGFRESQEQAKVLRAEIEKFAESFGKIDEFSGKLDGLAAGHVKTSGTVKAGTVVTEEYARTVKELVAAKKELEAASVKADAAGEALNAADERAAEIKKKLTTAQRELNTVTKQLAATHNSYSGDIIGLAEREGKLKTALAELKNEYAKTQKEVAKFDAKLEDSASTADAARAKYDGLKTKLAGLPPPVEKLANEAKRANIPVTRFTRGISGMAMVAGSSIPGISGLGSAISMFTMAAGPAGIAVGGLALAVGAGAGIYKTYASVVADAAKMSRELATESAKGTEVFATQANSNQKALDRLQELNSYDSLYDIQKKESLELVGKLSAAYKSLGLVYHETTGKVMGLSEAQAKMTEQDKAAYEAKLKEQYEDAQLANKTQRRDSASNAVSSWRTIWEGALWGIGSTSSNGNTETTNDEAKKFAKSLEGIGIEEQVERLKARVKDFKEVIAEGGGTAWAREASHQLPQWKKLLEAAELELKAKQAIAEHQKRNAIPNPDKEGKTTTQSDYLASLGKTAHASAAGMRELFDETGKYGESPRLATDAELLKAQDERLSALIKKHEELRGMKDDAETNHDNKAMTAEEARLRVEKEIADITKQRLQYEEKKQKEIANLQKQLAESKKGFIYDKDGNMERRKTQEELAGDRNQEIARLKQQLSFIDEAGEKYVDGKVNSLKEAIDPEKFNTVLSESEERIFKKWFEKNKKRGLIHAEDTGVDYDFRGAFKAGFAPEKAGDHWIDQWKKPNHETFSNESQYAKGIYEALAGKWNGDSFVDKGAVSQEALTKNRLEAEKELNRLQAERLDYEKQARNALYSDLNNMRNSLTRYRETTQTAINASSIEGLRMQSRQSLSGANFQKATAENTKKMSDSISSQGSAILNQLKDIFEKFNEFGAEPI